MNFIEYTMYVKQVLYFEKVFHLVIFNQDKICLEFRRKFFITTKKCFVQLFTKNLRFSNVFSHLKPRHSLDHHFQPSFWFQFSI